MVMNLNEISTVINIYTFVFYSIYINCICVKNTGINNGWEKNSEILLL